MLAGAEPVQISISEDAKEPGFSPLRLAKLAQFLLGFAKRFLDQVLGVRGSSAEPIGIAVKRFVMVVHQRLHACLTAGKSHVGIPLLSKNPIEPVYSRRSGKETCHLANFFPSTAGQSHYANVKRFPSAGLELC